MSKPADIALTAVLTILIITDTVSNLLVIFVIKKNKDMRTPISYLLVNLAVSDITFAVFVAPNHILKKIFTHPEGGGGSELCRMLTSGNFAWVGAASSSLTLVAIAVERYYTVMGPLGSKGKLNKRRVKVSKQQYI
ncbi:neuropeptide FF receptor 1-like [Orbicella faveolata]|uniref:neuropeptide FF receptor 1-like n=1 Tax=Orbicella faveolata TaxID=48498 RepID=UPI0009E52842|nr:neuropeptide FF receptor 1-like [Orbicella faveolata]